MNRNQIRIQNKERIKRRRDSVQNIFFFFLMALPVFYTLPSIFSKRKKTGKPSRRQLLGKHTLAG